MGENVIGGLLEYFFMKCLLVSCVMYSIASVYHYRHNFLYNIFPMSILGDTPFYADSLVGTYSKYYLMKMEENMFGSLKCWSIIPHREKWPIAVSKIALCMI